MADDAILNCNKARLTASKKLKMKQKYNPYQCPRCLDMEFSYFDNEVHRWCRAFNSALTEMVDLKSAKYCKKFNHPKGSKKKSKYLDESKYLMRHPE